LLNQKKDLAEREGFEPPVRFPVHLISSQAPSTGLGHLSVENQLVSRLLTSSQFLAMVNPSYGGCLRFAFSRFSPVEIASLLVQLRSLWISPRAFLEIVPGGKLRPTPSREDPGLYDRYRGVISVPIRETLIG
jgi:hypothetical protein